jgi:PQQ-dependent catabolism-associated CXXCW motif protein
VRRAAALLVLMLAAAAPAEPTTVPGGTVIHTEALRRLIDERRPILIDVLPAPRRPEGLRPTVMFMPPPREDIPGSLWLPDVGREAIDASLDAFFRAELARATGGDRDRAIVFYCRAHCLMSRQATTRAAGYGYTHVYWYPDGTDGWDKAGLPLAVARPRTPAR